MGIFPKVVYFIIVFPFFALGLLTGVIFDALVFGFNEGMDMWGVRK